MSPLDDPAPGDLAARLDEARGGATDALGQLLDSFRQYLLCVADRVIPDGLKVKIAPSSAVQETLLKGAENFHQFRGGSEESLRAWLRQILLNHLANTVRNHRDTHRREAGREVLLGDVSGRHNDEALTTPSPCQDAILAEERDRLHRALAQLPEQQRQVIELRNYERLSFARIGEQMGRTEEAARQLWRRAVEQRGQLLGRADGA